MPVYSFVVPIYNEAETLSELYKRLVGVFSKLDGDAEAILIDDGSRDVSYEAILRMQHDDRRFKVVRFSRNFGHQTAITAGIDLAAGQAIILMDADLQDPPELAIEMARYWRQGFDVVYGVRNERLGESWFKQVTASWFYRILRKLTDVDIPANVGDFRLMDRKVRSVFLELREKSRFMRGLVGWAGFRQIGIPYTRLSRFAGTTKYPFKKMMRLALDAVVSFSNIPLRLALMAGFFVSLVSFMMGFAVILLKIFRIYTFPGWASLTVAISFLGGIQLLVVGLVGEYVGRIYEEVKNRPLYIVSEMHGFSESLPDSPKAVICKANEF